MHWFLRSRSAAAPHCAANRLWRRRRRPAWWAFALFALIPLLARATSVVPPTFHELVTEAQTIAEGTVTAVQSRWVDGPQGNVIKTFVTFSVQKTLKGDARDSVTLEFLGGTVGTDTLHVAGMPEFKVGQHEIVFVEGNGVQFCPLVRFGHGRYHVHTDANSHRRFVTRNDDSPLRSVADVQRPTEAAAPSSGQSSTTALSSDDFEAQIATEVSHGAGQP